MPQDLRHQLLIYKFFSRVNQVMAGDVSSPTGHPSATDYSSFMRLLESDFEDLKRRLDNQGVSSEFLSPWYYSSVAIKVNTNVATVINEINLLHAHLQLRCYYFFEDPSLETRKQGLIKAFTTALILVNKVQEVEKMGHFIRYAPNIFARMLTVAALLLMKIINSSYARYVDIMSGKKAFSDSLAILRDISLESGDLHDRVCHIMEQLWTVHQAVSMERDQEPTVNLKTRLGGSLLHDSLWTWRDVFGGQGVKAGQSGHITPVNPASSVVNSGSPQLLQMNDSMNPGSFSPKKIQHGSE